MAGSNTGAEFLGVIPQPRQVRVDGGRAALDRGVHLEAEQLPDRWRRMAEQIFARAGVRTTGGFAVEVRLDKAEDLDLADVPEAVRQEYYELEVQADRARIRACDPAGARWGVHTLAGLCRSASRGAEIPRLEIRDWPDMASRGVFVEDKWGPDRMELADWELVLDRLAGLKMNRMGVGLYGCWGNCRYEGVPTEFLMVPVPGHPELKSEKRLRWYSPKDGQWHGEVYLPRMFAQDFFGQVVAAGRDRGVTVIPFVNSLGHNTLIPRLVPEISAKAADGRPVGMGYCLSNPATRQFIEGFYRSIVARYFPGGAEFFHVQLDEVWPDFPDPDDPGRQADPWCQCPQCRARAREESLHDYVLWLIGMLVRQGVRKVVMWNDQLTRHMDALDEGFVGRLRQAGLADQLILHWWWYSNEALHEKTRVAIGRKLGLAGWVAPMTCYFNWERYSPTRRNVELMLRMGHEEGAEGAVSYAVHDPGWVDHEMLMAGYAWNGEAVGSPQAQEERWARLRFGEQAEAYLHAQEALERATSQPAVSACYNYPYTYCRADVPFPRPYPGEALARLGKMETAAPQLAEAVRWAEEAGAGFAAVAAGAPAEEERAEARSLRAQAARVEGLARGFTFLFSAWQAVAAGRLPDRAAAECAQVRAALLGCMAAMEEGMPAWVVPASLQALSALLEFLGQLQQDLDEVRAGKRALKDIRWQLAGREE